MKSKIILKKTRKPKLFSECANVIKESFLPSNNVSVPYIGLEHIEQNTLRFSSIGDSSKVVSQKFKFKKGDILFGKLRPYFRKVVRPFFDGICSTDIFVVRAKEEISQTFLYYLMASHEFVDYSSQGTEGTRMPRTTWDFLGNFEQEIPSFDVQEKIGEILHALDSKIDILHNQNKILEQIAQAIFKSWFVDFDGVTEWDDSELDKIPKGYQIVPFKELASCVKGFSYKGVEKFNEFKGYEFVTLNSIKEGGGFKKKVTWLDSDRLKERHFVKEIDLIIANTEQTKDARLLATPALVQFSHDYDKQLAVYSHHISKIEPKIQNSKFYLYSFFLYYQQPIANAYHTGTGVWGFDHTGFENNHSILEPSSEILEKFEKNTFEIHVKIIKNEKSISLLMSVRDILLPKLMSGEIRV